MNKLQKLAQKYRVKLADNQDPHLQNLARRFAIALRKQLANQKDPQIKIGFKSTMAQHMPDYPVTPVIIFHFTPQNKADAHNPATANTAKNQYKLMTDLLSNLLPEGKKEFPKLMISVKPIGIPGAEPKTLT